MKRITVSLPDEVYEQLCREALRSHSTISSIIRSRLENASRAKKRFTSRRDPLLSVAGICRGPVISKSVDDELYGLR